MRFRPSAFPPARLVLATGLALSLGACATGGGFTSLWKDPQWTSPPMKNVYVVALRRDPVRRRMWEDGLVEGLARHGVQATSSYRQFPDAPPDTQQVIAEVRANGYDGVVVSIRLPNEEQVVQLPGYTTTEPVTRRNPFTGAYYTRYIEVERPSREERSTIRKFQTDVWTTADGGRLVWSGKLETLEEVNSKVVRRIASTRIVDELSKVGIAPPLPGKSK